jgi:hypothetical protein
MWQTVSALAGGSTGPPVRTCWSIMRGLGAEKRMYSSKMELNAHFWTFRSAPTRQPVRC